MWFRRGCLSVPIVLLVLLWPVISVATITDLHWRVHEGDEISYTLRGLSEPSGNLTIEEEIYFVVDGLIGIPIPGISGVITDGAPSVSAYWANRTTFDAEGWFSNIHLVSAIVVRVGNWSLYAELTNQTVDSRNDQYRDLWLDPTFDRYEVVLHETAEVWNVTVFISVYNGTGGQLTGLSSFEYSKADGVLSSGYYIQEPENENYYQSLSIIRIDNESNLPFQLVIIGVVTVTIVVIIIILVNQRK